MKQTIFTHFLFMMTLLASVVMTDTEAFAQSDLSRQDSIVSDFETFIKIIEDTHPDAYTNFGGRVLFHKMANDIRQKLKNDSTVTINDLYKHASEFISRLQDGHSFINSPKNQAYESGSDSLLVIKLICGDDKLIVNSVDSVHSNLIGCRVVGMNGVPIEEILERVGVKFPCENTAGKIGLLCNWFRPISFYRGLLDDQAKTISFDLVTPIGDSIKHIPKTVQFNQFKTVARAYAPQDKRFPTAQMEWKEIEENMFFRLSSVMARENFEFQYNNGWDFYSQLEYYYNLSGSELPSDTLKAINNIPFLSETFSEMLEEMKRKNLKNLVIDLRGNGGGWTPIVLPTLYMMFGDDYLKKDMDARFYRRISDLYLKKINSDIDTFNSANGLQLKPGDYIFPDETVDMEPIERKRQYFIDTAMCSDSIKKKLLHLKGEPIYRPERIYVVTDAGTFSAAFHYAFYLSKLGSIIAGETSSQAPNCYMEVTPFCLPLTGLTGSVSNAMQVFLPIDDTRAKEFIPAIRMSYEEYADYDFDSNSILLYLLGAELNK